MKIKNIVCGIGLCLVVFACDKKDIPLFESDDSAVYFQYVSKWVLGTGQEYYNDSITFSFASSVASVKSATLQATLRTMGKVVDYDRPVKIVVDKAGSTAIEGVHFENHLDTIKIPAGQNEVKFRVKVFRTEDMLNKAIRLKLQLVENEHFKLLIDDYKNTNSYTASGGQVSGTTFVFSVSEIYTQPSYWSYMSDSFGAWTLRKYMVINEVMGWTAYDWTYAGMTGQKIASGRRGFAAMQVQKELQRRADAGNPERDGDGYVQLVSPYLVDYSAYIK